MPIVSWTPDLATGVEALDADHQRLIATMNSVFDALLGGDCSTQCRTALTTLRDYVDEHFAREEDWLRQQRDPGLERHLSEHRLLRAEVAHLLQMQQASPEELSTDMLLILRQWLMLHIAGSDRRAAHFGQAA